MTQKWQMISFGGVFLVLALLFPFLFSLTQAALGTPTAIATGTEELPMIILDAGHGGEDGGATGTNGVAEKALNLQFTQALAALLRLNGYTVIETRTEDKLLYGANVKKGHKKQEDLQNRLAFTEEYPNSIFISIHMNTYPDQSCTGTQVWYSRNHAESAEWASAVQKSVTELLQPGNHRKTKAAGGNIYLLHRAQTPAILIECGFLSTPADCERLCDPTYRLELAMAIFSAITQKISAQS